MLATVITSTILLSACHCSSQGMTYTVYIFSASERSHRFWSPSTLLFNGYRGSFMGVKRTGSEFNNKSSSGAEVKNEWSYTSTPSVCLSGQGKVYVRKYVCMYVCMYVRSRVQKFPA